MTLYGAMGCVAPRPGTPPSGSGSHFAAALVTGIFDLTPGSCAGVSGQPQAGGRSTKCPWWPESCGVAFGPIWVDSLAAASEDLLINMTIIRLASWLQPSRCRSSLKRQHGRGHVSAWRGPPTTHSSAPARTMGAGPQRRSAPFDRPVGVCTLKQWASFTRGTCPEARADILATKPEPPSLS
jgi:hypothetical protein